MRELSEWKDYGVFNTNGQPSNIDIESEEDLELVSSDPTMDKDAVIGRIEEKIETLETVMYVVRQELGDSRQKNDDLRAEVERLKKELVDSLARPRVSTATTSVPVTTTNVPVSTTTTNTVNVTSVDHDVEYYARRMKWRLDNGVGNDLVKCHCGFEVTQRTAFRHYAHYQKYGRCTSKRVFKPKGGESNKKRKSS